MEQIPPRSLFWTFQMFANATSFSRKNLKIFKTIIYLATMGMDTKLSYPTPFEVIKKERAGYRIEIKFSLLNLADGVYNLGKTLLLDLFLITVLMSPIYLLFYVVSGNVIIPLNFGPDIFRFTITPVTSIKHLYYWIIMIYLIQRSREFHEEDWNSYRNMKDLYEDSIIGALDRTYVYIKEKYRVIFSLVFYFVLLGLLNFILFTLTAYTHRIQYYFNIFLFEDFFSISLIASSLFFGFFYARFGPAALYIVREELDFVKSLEESWNITGPFSWKLQVVYTFLIFLSYFFRPVALPLLFITIICCYYLLNANRMPLGKIWPSSKYKKDIVLS